MLIMRDRMALNTWLDKAIFLFIWIIMWGLGFAAQPVNIHFFLLVDRTPSFSYYPFVERSEGGYRKEAVTKVFYSIRKAFSVDPHFSFPVWIAGDKITIVEIPPALDNRGNEIKAYFRAYPQFTYPGNREERIKLNRWLIKITTPLKAPNGKYVALSRTLRQLLWRYGMSQETSSICKVIVLVTDYEDYAKQALTEVEIKRLKEKFIISEPSDILVLIGSFPSMMKLHNKLQPFSVNLMAGRKAFSKIRERCQSK